MSFLIGGKYLNIYGTPFINERFEFMDQILEQKTNKFKINITSKDEEKLEDWAKAIKQLRNDGKPKVTLIEEAQKIMDDPFVDSIVYEDAETNKEEAEEVLTKISLVLL